MESVAYQMDFPTEEGFLLDDIKQEIKTEVNHV